MDVNADSAVKLRKTEKYSKITSVPNFDTNIANLKTATNHTAQIKKEMAELKVHTFYIYYGERLVT